MGRFLVCAGDGKAQDASSRVIIMRRGNLVILLQCSDRSTAFVDFIGSVNWCLGIARRRRVGALQSYTWIFTGLPVRAASYTALMITM
jgi:hypothetical protein